MIALVMRVQRAIRIKRIVRVVSGIHRRGLLTIHQDGLFLQAMNPEHRIPAALTLCSSWFHSYTLFAPDSDSSWTFEFDLHSFHLTLDLISNDQELHIYVILGFGQNSDSFYVLNHQDGMPSIHEIEIQRSYCFEFTNYQNEIEHSYGFGFRIVMRPNHFVHVLQHSIEPPQPVIVSVANAMIMMASGETKRYLSEGPYCLIQRYPKGRVFSIRLSLYAADYCIEAASMGRTIAISVADLELNPELPPVLCVLIDQSATIHFFFYWDSIVDPIVKEFAA